MAPVQNNLIFEIENINGKFKIYELMDKKMYLRF